MYERHSAAAELISAADATEGLWPHVIFQKNLTAFTVKHQLPTNVVNRDVDPNQDWHQLGGNWQSIWSESCSTGRVTIERDSSNGDLVLIWKAPDDENTYWLLHHRNEELLKTIAKDV
jgi:hypothetical protein